jgi:GTP-binding protein LepA
MDVENKAWPFCVMAHVEHGKTNLLDRLREHTNAFVKRKMQDQLPDSMDLECERGLLIMNSKRAKARDLSAESEDTPGHADFAHEVSRSLATCEGALLSIAVSQGIETQTGIDANLAMGHGLAIIPVTNKQICQEHTWKTFA